MLGFSQQIDSTHKNQFAYAHDRIHSTNNETERSGK